MDTKEVEVTPSARTLPRGLASIVEALELDQTRLVTLRTLEELAAQAAIRTSGKVLAARLRTHGWLLATSQRGVYEFAPGAHAGALSRGDVTLPFQAVLHARPELEAGLAFQSAAWALGAADRAPARLEVAASTRVVTTSLARVLGAAGRVVTFAPRLPWRHSRGVPVLAADSVLVHMATRPRDVRSWSSALEWLPEIAAEATEQDLRAELDGRPAAVSSRLAYLLSGLRPDMVIAPELPSRAGPVYFGPRGAALRYDSARRVIDTVLPTDPRALPAAA